METVELLGNLGEFLASIGVVATLIYLAIQIRESRKTATFAAVQANRSERIANFIGQRDSPYITPILVKSEAGEALTAEESSRLFAHHGATWALLYAEWVQRELGLMGEFAIRDEVPLSIVFGSASARQWWTVGGRHIYPPQYVEAIEAAMAEFDRGSGSVQHEETRRMVSGA
jgi:hypothetical protein